MKAMILSAGRGERMMPLTAACPKPMLIVAGKPLIQHHIEKLVAAGIDDIVINVSYLGEQIIEHIGNGKKFDANIIYSKEENVLETAGGIRKALPFLGGEPFVVVNADVWIDLDYASLKSIEFKGRAHLIMVPNPEHNPSGDFILKEDGKLELKQESSESPCYTYSGLGLYSNKLFNVGGFHSRVESSPEKEALLPLFEKAIDKGFLRGELYSGYWMDVGVPERLQQLDERLSMELSVS